MTRYATALNRAAHIVAGAIAVPLTIIISFAPPPGASWTILIWFALMGGFAGYGIYKWD